jgi:RNA polymerase sigma-70 factor (ECF subfamily)
LLARLQGPRDEQAWSEFVAIYQPLIYRLIRSRGLQDADARELAQDALAAVARSLAQGGDFEGGSFRAWLSRIARNMMLNYLTRTRPGDRGSGGSDFQRLLAEQPALDPEQATIYDLEQKRELFCWAADRIRDSFQPVTWQAFWRTSVDGQPVAQAAEALGISVGSVYAARSRVMARLKKIVEEWEAEDRGARNEH